MLDSPWPRFTRILRTYSRPAGLAARAAADERHGSARAASGLLLAAAAAALLVRSASRPACMRLKGGGLFAPRASEGALHGAAKPGVIGAGADFTVIETLRRRATGCGHCAGQQCVTNVALQLMLGRGRLC